MGEIPIDIKSILFEALEKKDIQERALYLDSVCGDKASLRAEVESLLESHEQARDFLPSPDLDPEVTLEGIPLTEGPGTIIGPYRLLERIGEGGMASVYMAEQKKPIRRKVALKIIKLGMDTKQVIARFEAERQALAVMDHPNIAKVLDAGATQTGRPYFVMELVKGVSITEYCETNKLTIQQRLELFVPVCNAIQHAHQKGIIHRDIKPSNVMVTLHDGKPVPKVIDFGIAKATNQQLTEKTLFTRYSQMIGTPVYMSPEQAEMSGLDIDTRTDIYSLGVLLFELLTNSTPFDAEELRKAGYIEIQRIIREEEPLKPSTKLSTLGERLTSIAEHRRTGPDLLRRLLSGDLDWIVMKSLDKDRTRRYETVNALAMDVQRHLNHEPVLAASLGTAYRLRKFVRKHRKSVIVGAVVLIILIAGIVVSTIFAVGQARARADAEYQRQVAERNRAEAMDARDQAQREAKLVQALIPFQGWDLYPSLHTWGGTAREAVIGAALANVSQRLEREFEGPPLIEASVRGSLGMSFQSIGEYKAAEPHLERAWKIREEQLGKENPSTLVSQTNIAVLYMKQGRYNEAEPLLVTTLEVSRTALGEKHVVTQDALSILERLLKKYALQADQQYHDSSAHPALLTLTRVDKLRQAFLGSECPPSELALMTMILHELDHNMEAEATLDRLRSFLESDRRLCEPYEKYLSTAEQLLADREGPIHQAWECIEVGKLREASFLIEKLQQSHHQENDWTIEQVRSVRKALARAYYRRGKKGCQRGVGCAKTITDYEMAIRINPGLGGALNDLAWLRATSALPEFRDGTMAIDAATKACTLTDWENYGYIGTLAAAYAETGDFPSAVKWQKEALDLLPADKKLHDQAKMMSRLKLYQSGMPCREERMKPMVAWWKFDKAEGRDVIDSSGNALNGKLIAGASIVEDPERGNVLNLNGDGGYVDCGSHRLFNITDEITVMAWIRPRALDKWWQPIVNKGESSWRLQRWHAHNVLEFGCTGVNVECNQFSHLLGTVNINDGKWHHIAGVYDGTAVYLYVDGVCDTYERASGNLDVSDEPVLIGGNPHVPGRTWNGLIDDVRIYNYALSEAELKTIYAGRHYKSTRDQ